MVVTAYALLSRANPHTFPPKPWDKVLRRFGEPWDKVLEDTLQDTLPVAYPRSFRHKTCSCQVDPFLPSRFFSATPY